MSALALCFQEAARADEMQAPSNRDFAIPRCHEVTGEVAAKIKMEFIVFGTSKGFFDPDLEFLRVDQEFVISGCIGFYTVGIPLEEGARGSTYLFFFRALEPIFGVDRFLDTRNNWVVSY